MGRTGNIFKNAVWKFISTISSALISFICRWFFIYYIGDTLLGVNSLFSDVLALFSFAEMGIGPALTYSLYKPIAEKNTEKIQSLLCLYRQMYRGVMILISIIGIAFIPFLNNIKSNNPIPHLYLYYSFFLVNNILSYVCAYKRSYVEACQKAYCIQHITLITSLMTNVFQIGAIIVTRDYRYYLVVALIVQIITIIWNDYYISRHFPETVFSKAKPIDKVEWREIKNQIGGLLIQRVGNLGISQTDSIIVSMVVNVVEWGFVSNYNTLSGILGRLVYHFYSCILPSIGNVVATDTKERQKQLFRVYNLFNEWIYYNCFLGIALLSTPIISIVFGEQRTLRMGIVALIAFNILFSGLLYPIVGIKEANGIFTVGKWLPAIACVVNLVTSIWFVNLFGTIGVFIGTICSTIVSYVQPFLVWKKIYGKGVSRFYLSSAKTIIIGLTVFSFLYKTAYIGIWEQWSMTWYVRIVLLAVIELVFSNIIFVLINIKNDSLMECWLRIKIALHM